MPTGHVNQKAELSVRQMTDDRGQKSEGRSQRHCVLFNLEEANRGIRRTNFEGRFRSILPFVTQK